jgi:hypothetical protein
VNVGDTGLSLEDSGPLQLDLFGSEVLKQTAPMAEEHRDDMQLELVEGASRKGEPRDSRSVDQHVPVARPCLALAIAVLMSFTGVTNRHA